MKKLCLILGLLASNAVFAGQQVVCGQDDVELNKKLAQFGASATVSPPSVAIASAAPGIAIRPDFAYYERVTAVETKALVCVTVKY